MSLSTTYDKLRREIGRFLGYGRDPDQWTGDKAYYATDVGDVLENGLRRFYWPMLPVQKYKDGPVTQERYVWSFMTVNSDLNIQSGTHTYSLPDGFTDVLSDGFSYAVGDGLRKVARVSDDDLTTIQAMANRSGDPQYFSIRSRSTVSGTQTAYEVTFYPTPDTTRTLNFGMGITPPELSSTNQHPLGGAQYSEAILQACLAEAEKMLDDEEGLHEKRFRELLAAAIELDRKLSIPDTDMAWPLENPSPGLNVNKAYLKRLIGKALGHGPHPGVWNNIQINEVQLALETGLRKFYTPQILPGERYAHDWSFLRPTRKFSLTGSVYRYDLPVDFVMLKGDQILFEPGASVLYPPIKLVSERMVMRRHEQTTSTARPEIAAIRPKDPAHGAGTFYELLVFPTPDDDYDVNMPYSINPGMLSDEVSLPLGGQPHMQTVIEACLCAVEEQQGKPSVHAQAFLDCLRASVSHDRRVGSPESLGFNRDRTEVADPYIANWHNCDENIVSYNGIEY